LATALQVTWQNIPEDCNFFNIHCHESPRYPTLLAIDRVITHYTVLNWSLKHIMSIPQYFIMK